MKLSPSERCRKLNQLVADFGFATHEEMAESALCDSVAPAICVNPDCDYSTDMEPDQTAGYCEACGTRTVVSGLVLLGVI